MFNDRSLTTTFWYIFLFIAFLASVSRADLVSNGIAVNEHTIITTSHGVFGTDSGKTIVNGSYVSLRLMVQSRQEEEMVDLAIVTVPDSIHLKACQIAPIFAKDGEIVEMYGNVPGKRKLDKYKVSGPVSDYDSRMPFDYVYSIGVKGKHGISGGPLYYKGHIIGMNLAMRTDENVTYSYTSDILIDYLEQANVKIKPNTKNNKKCVYPIIGYTQKNQ